MSKKEKKSKHRYVSSESESSTSQSSGSSSSSTSSSESENERIPVFKKPKLDVVLKKRHRKERKKLEKKKRLKETNKITKDDFYVKSLEFRLWLMEEKKLSMDEMKTTKSKSYFKKFVRKWNGGKLPKKYYKGIDSADARSSSLTKYRWKFADKANSAGVAGSSGSPYESGERSSIAKKTLSTFGKVKSSLKTTPAKVVLGPEKPVIGPQRPPHMFLEQDSETVDKESERKRIREERKQFREHDKLVMDELAPRATGFDAKIEKKRMRRQRRDSPEFSDVRLMGAGMDHATMMRKKHKQDAARRERNITKASTKLKEYQEKETAKMKALLDIARASKSKDALW